jgi:hypothetical protein
MNGAEIKKAAGIPHCGLPRFKNAAPAPRSLNTERNLWVCGVSKVGFAHGTTGLLQTSDTRSTCRFNTALSRYEHAHPPRFQTLVRQSRRPAISNGMSARSRICQRKEDQWQQLKSLHSNTGMAQPSLLMTGRCPSSPILLLRVAPNFSLILISEQSLARRTRPHIARRSARSPPVQLHSFSSSRK